MTGRPLVMFLRERVDKAVFTLNSIPRLLKCLTTAGEE